MEANKCRFNLNRTSFLKKQPSFKINKLILCHRIVISHPSFSLQSPASLAKSLDYTMKNFN